MNLSLNYALVVLLSIFCFSSNAQQLTLNQIKKIRLMDDEQINDYLLAKHWVFRGTSTPHPTLRGGANWSFKDAKSYGGYSAFLSSSISIANEQRHIIYMTLSRANYIAIKKQIIESGLLKTSTEPRQEDCIETVYTGSTYWISTAVCTNRNLKSSPVVYKIAIQ